VDISPVYKFEPHSLYTAQPIFSDGVARQSLPALSLRDMLKEMFLSGVRAGPISVRPAMRKNGAKSFGKLSQLDGEDHNNGFLEECNNKHKVLNRGGPSADSAS
jgi:hypothetical protein